MKIAIVLGPSCCLLLDDNQIPKCNVGIRLLKHQNKTKQHDIWANHDPRAIPQIFSREKATKSMNTILLPTLEEEGWALHYCSC